MRLYKIFHYYIDLDHVLSLSDPDDDVMIGLDYYIGFGALMAFQEKPMHIKLDGSSPLFKEWNKTFVHDEGIMPSFKHDHAKIQFCRAMIPELKKAHELFIEAWSQKPKKKEKVQQSGHGFVPSGVKIMRDGPYLYLLDDQGNPFKNQISCTIKDRVNKPTIAIIKANVSEIVNKEDHG